MISTGASIAIAEIGEALSAIKNRHDLDIERVIHFYGANDSQHQNPVATLAWDSSGQAYRIATRMAKGDVS